MLAEVRRAYAAVLWAWHEAGWRLHSVGDRHIQHAVGDSSTEVWRAYTVRRPGSWNDRFVVMAPAKGQEL
jgi:hypothetical protein